MRHHYCHIMNTCNIFIEINTIQKISWEIQIFRKSSENLEESLSKSQLGVSLFYKKTEQFAVRNRTICHKKLNKLLRKIVNKNLRNSLQNKTQ